MNDNVAGLRKAASFYSTWAGVIIMLGLVGAGLMAFGAFEPEVCNSYSGACHTNAAAQWGAFAGLAFMAVLPSLPLFALSRVLDGVSDVLKEVQEEGASARRARKQERES